MPEFLGDVLAYLAQIGGLRVEREPSAEASAGEFEQLKDHPRHAFAAADNARRRPSVLVVELAAAKQQFRLTCGSP